MLIKENKLKFNDVIGNETVKDLFLGTDGIGKLKLAKEFAKFVLCVNNKEEDCNCKSCLCYNGNNHPDFLCINEERKCY